MISKKVTTIEEDFRDMGVDPKKAIREMKESLKTNLGTSVYPAGGKMVKKESNERVRDFEDYDEDIEEIDEDALDEAFEIIKNSEDKDELEEAFKIVKKAIGAAARRAAKKAKRYYKKHRGKIKRMAAKYKRSAAGKKTAKTRKRYYAKHKVKPGKRLVRAGMDNVADLTENLNEVVNSVIGHNNHEDEYENDYDSGYKGSYEDEYEGEYGGEYEGEYEGNYEIDVLDKISTINDILANRFKEEGETEVANLLYSLSNLATELADGIESGDVALDEVENRVVGLLDGLIVAIKGYKTLVSP
jgi:chemotaxis protein histidine kinase CheA